MPTRRDIVLPDDIYNLFLKPLAKRLKIRHLPRSSLGILKSIFRKLAETRKKIKTPKLLSILEDVKAIIEPVSLTMQIGAEMLRPLISVIPPQYLIVIVLAVLVPTVIFPAFILGIFGTYKAEEWIKVPFKYTQKKIDQIPKILRQENLIIKKIQKRTLTFKLKEWHILTEADRQAFIYEAPADVKILITALEVALNIFRGLTIEEIMEEMPQQVDMLPPILRDNFQLIDYNREVTLTETSYIGWRRVLPPVVHRFVNGIQSVFKYLEEIDFAKRTEQLPWWRVLLGGIFGPLGQLIPWMP